MKTVYLYYEILLLLHTSNEVPKVYIVHYVLPTLPSFKYMLYKNVFIYYKLQLVQKRKIISILHR